jgi:hypothetical protein
VKALLSGVGVAAVAGLLMGGAMKPNLGTDDRPAGPQILAGWSAERSTGPFDDGGYANYADRIPDYVTGTDWRKALAEAEAPVEPAPHRVAVREAAPEAVQFTQASIDATPDEPVTYPSMAGGTPNAADLPQPPPPPDDEPSAEG